MIGCIGSYLIANEGHIMHCVDVLCLIASVSFVNCYDLYKYQSTT